MRYLGPLLEFTQKWGAQVLLVHVARLYPPFAYPENQYLNDLQEREDQILAAANKQLAQFVATQGARAVRVETRAVVGSAVREICQIAEQEQVDLIVMESHGRTNLTDVVLGSMAERVGQHAPCPVLVVQLPKEGN
jgi:nucleotide-binding universal stress UspA family protein